MNDSELLEKGFAEERHMKRKPDRDFVAPVNPLSDVEKEIIKRLCTNYAIQTYSYTADKMGMVAPHERVPGSSRIPDCEQDGFIFFERCILKFDKNKYDRVTVELMEDKDLSVREFTLKNIFNEYIAKQARFGLNRDRQDYLDAQKREIKLESQGELHNGEYYANEYSDASHLLEQLSKNGVAIESQEIKTLSSMLKGQDGLVNFFILKYVEEMSAEHLKIEFGADYGALVYKTQKIVKRMRKIYGKK